MSATLKELIRDALRESGDPSARGLSKEVVLRHVLREATWISSRFPNIIRAEGSPSDGPTNEVTVWDITQPVPNTELVIKDVWINGERIEHVSATDLEGVIE